MDSCVPLPLEHDKLMDLVDKAKDYCLMHGICMRQKDRDCNRICWGLIHPPIMNINVLLLTLPYGARGMIFPLNQRTYVNIIRVKAAISIFIRAPLCVTVGLKSYLVKN